MSRLRTKDSTITLIAGIDGDLQIMRDQRTGNVLLDIQGSHRDTAGHVRQDHGTIHMTHDGLVELGHLIDEFIALRARAAEDTFQLHFWAGNVP